MTISSPSIPNTQASLRATSHAKSVFAWRSFSSPVYKRLRGTNIPHLFLFFVSMAYVPAIQADNPIIKHLRTADPSAHIWSDGKVWIYTSHDMDDATDYGSMDGYHVFSSSDMVTWKDHGEILHSKNVSWAVGGSMYAPSAASKNGMYYLYFPTMSKEWKWRIGVATSSKPEGPFKDIGNYIAGTDHIDPCCFVDDDGAAYLYWGGDLIPPRVAKLKETMIELAETPRIIDYGSDNFGEGSYMHKRKGVYYFSYNGYGGKYAMGDNPYGPFAYKGVVNGNDGTGAQDHHSMIEYRGRWYFFYHIGNYQNGTMCRRNVCVDYLYYNADGTMKEVVLTKKGVDPVGINGKWDAKGARAAKMTLLTGTAKSCGAVIRIGFNIPERVCVDLGLYDIKGNLLRKLVCGVREKGCCELLLDAGNFSSGRYLFKFRTGAGGSSEFFSLCK